MADDPTQDDDKAETPKADDAPASGEDPFGTGASGSAFSAGDSGAPGAAPPAEPDEPGEPDAGDSDTSTASTSEPRPLFNLPDGSSARAKVTAPPESAENSGLVDLREIAAGMSGSHKAVDDDDSMDALDGGFGSMAAAPLVDAPLARPAASGSRKEAPPPAPANNGVLYGIIAALTVAVCFMGYKLATVEPPTPPEKIAAMVAAELEKERSRIADERDDRDRDRDRDDDKDDGKDKKDDGDEDDGAGDTAGTTGGGSDTGSATEGDAADAKSGTRRRRGKRRGSAPTGTPEESKADAPPEEPEAAPEEPAPEPAKASSDVDCLLDPSAPGCGGSKPKAKPKTAEPAVDPNLPAKLSQSQLRTGFGAVKGSAKACGPKHGAASGTKVKVRVSIAGASGSVVAATPQAVDNKALGKCVADALRKAKFPKFKSKQMGSVYSVTM